MDTLIKAIAFCVLCWFGITIFERLKSGDLEDGRAYSHWIGMELPELPSHIAWVNRPGPLEGKAVLLEFWATWCPPCLESIPHLNQIHADFADMGLVIASLTEEDPTTIRTFMRKQVIDYPVGSDISNEMARVFGVQAIPTAFLTNRSGRIIWAGHPLSLKKDHLVEALAILP
ncbi:MAG: TlpA disulfide reductase family protein [Puniceicoccaceae bacterium]